jgi:hypothetical protein
MEAPPSPAFSTNSDWEILDEDTQFASISTVPAWATDVELVDLPVHDQYVPSVGKMAPTDIRPRSEAEEYNTHSLRNTTSSYSTPVLVDTSNAGLSVAKTSRRRHSGKLSSLPVPLISSLVNWSWTKKPNHLMTPLTSPSPSPSPISSPDYASKESHFTFFETLPSPSDTTSSSIRNVIKVSDRCDSSSTSSLYQRTQTVMKGIVTDGMHTHGYDNETRVVCDSGTVKRSLSLRSISSLPVLYSSKRRKQSTSTKLTLDDSDQFSVFAIDSTSIEYDLTSLEMMDPAFDNNTPLSSSSRSITQDSTLSLVPDVPIKNSIESSLHIPSNEMNESNAAAPSLGNETPNEELLLSIQMSPSLPQSLISQIDKSREDESEAKQLKLLSSTSEVRAADEHGDKETSSGTLGGQVADIPLLSRFVQPLSNQLVLFF